MFDVALRTLASSLCLWTRIRRRLLMILYRPLFASHGRNFWFDPAGDYTFETIYVAHDVNLGIRPSLSATRSTIRIGSKVMFGPEVTIRGGNHRTDIIGRFMMDVGEQDKRPQDDLGVVIEDDVWVGTRAIILHGVTIGRGAVVAAGAVVTNNIPPYAIFAGIPAKLVRFRWDVETVLRHEVIAFSPAERFSREQLQAMQNQTSSRTQQ